MKLSSWRIVFSMLMTMPLSGLAAGIGAFVVRALVNPQFQMEPVTAAFIFATLGAVFILPAVFFTQLMVVALQSRDAPSLWFHVIASALAGLAFAFMLAGDKGIDGNSLFLLITGGFGGTMIGWLWFRQIFER
jgi:hypothetical protein